MSDMQKEIIDFVINEYVENDEEINGDTPLISSGIVDSFSMVNLKNFIERTYNVVVPDEKAVPEIFDTVNGVCKLVEELKAD